MERNAAYRIYIWPEQAEKTIHARANQLVPGVLVAGHLEKIPDQPIDWDEYFELWEVVNPALKFQLEKRLWVGPTFGMNALSYLLTFSGMTEEGEKEYLNDLKADKTIVAWDQPDQPFSFRWILALTPKQVVIPNLQGELHVLSQAYYLRVPRRGQTLYFTGIIDGSGERFYSDEQTEHEVDVLIFSLSPGQRLLFLAHKNTYPQKPEMVATALFFCPSEREIVFEAIDGLELEVIRKKQPTL